MDDDRGMDVMTIEFERGIGVINEPVRTIDDDRGRPTSGCCADARTTDEERSKFPPPFAVGTIGAAGAWEARTIDDDRGKAPGDIALGTIDIAGCVVGPPA